MTKDMINYYRAEWEATPKLTLEGLCAKYNLNKEELGDTTSWKKDQPSYIQPKQTPILAEVIHTPTPTPTQKEEVLADGIRKAKDLILKEVNDRLASGAYAMETKELKEIASIVEGLDKAARQTNTGQNINILVQNLVSKFRDDV